MNYVENFTAGDRSKPLPFFGEEDQIRQAIAILQSVLKTGGQKEERRREGSQQLIWCHDDGSIEMEDNTKLRLTKDQRIIMRKLESGMCNRDEVAEHLYGADTLAEMKNPKKTMRTNISRLNEKLRKYRLFIKADSLFYYLTKF